MTENVRCSVCNKPIEEGPAVHCGNGHTCCRECWPKGEPFCPICRPDGKAEQIAEPKAEPLPTWPEPVADTVTWWDSTHQSLQMVPPRPKDGWCGGMSVYILHADHYGHLNDTIDWLRSANRGLARTVSEQTLRIAELERSLAAAEEAGKGVQYDDCEEHADRALQLAAENEELRDKIDRRNNCIANLAMEHYSIDDDVDAWETGETLKKIIARGDVRVTPDGLRVSREDNADGTTTMTVDCTGKPSISIPSVLSAEPIGKDASADPGADE